MYATRGTVLHLFHCLWIWDINVQVALNMHLLEIGTMHVGIVLGKLNGEFCSPR
jgi:hypothetical protein